MDLAKFVGDVILSIIWAFIGVVILLAAIWLFDRIHPIDFSAEIKGGNAAAAILLGSVVLGLSLIVFAAVR